MGYYKHARLVRLYHRFTPLFIWSRLYNRGFCPITQEQDERLTALVLNMMDSRRG